MFILLLASLPLYVAGDHCAGASICPALGANIEAILGARIELGCCTHDSCMPEAGSGSVACSQDVASALQPCMQKDYAGDRAACMREAVGVNAPAVCASVPLRCEGLRSLTKVLQLTEAVSGCPMREGMVSIGAAIAVIFAGPIVIGAATTAAVANAVVAASPFLTAANFPPLIPNFISAQTSTQLQLAASLSAPTGIVLVGGNGPSQGNVFAKDPQGRWGAVCGNAFTLVNAHVVCQQLGYSQALKVYGVGPAVDGPGSRYGVLPFGFTYSYERVACAGTESRLMDCPITPVAAPPVVCDASTVAGIECV